MIQAIGKRSIELQTNRELKRERLSRQENFFAFSR